MPDTERDTPLADQPYRGFTPGQRRLRRIVRLGPWLRWPTIPTAIMLVSWASGFLVGVWPADLPWASAKPARSNIHRNRFAVEGPFLNEAAPASGSNFGFLNEVDSTSGVILRSAGADASVSGSTVPLPPANGTVGQIWFSQ